MGPVYVVSATHSTPWSICRGPPKIMGAGKRRGLERVPQFAEEQSSFPTHAITGTPLASVAAYQLQSDGSKHSL